MIGKTLAHYKILGKIGSGGMGDVYLAEDTELDRNVALKVLPVELAESEDRRARFKREAKAIAALNHPNIVTVYSVEESDSVHFITMERVKGKTLVALLPGQGFSLDAFFDIAVPLADAVAAAHAQGIVHRDLKPGNIMVTDEGRVKVLDFGLAKPTGGFAGTDAGSHLPTAAKTEQGVIVGTVSYMSPEQAQGKTVDARSDIFSLGIVFYEMLTGRRPFEGDTPAEALSSIIKDDAPAVSGIPREVSRIVRRCLSKDPSRRAQNALDIRIELDELRRELDSGELLAETRPTRTRRSRWTDLTVVGTVIALFALFRLISTGPPEVFVPRLENPVQITSAAGVENFPTWSPDGGRIAYESDQSDNLDIWVTQLKGGPAVNFTARHEGFDRQPAWSPDGNQIAFVSERDGGGIYVMPAIGGPSNRISPRAPDAGSYNTPQWSSDGAELAYILMSNQGLPFIEVVSLRTRESKRLAIPGEAGFRVDLSWSPDGRSFAYVRAPGAKVDLGRLWVLRASDGQAFAVNDGTFGVWCPMWSQDARTLFFLSGRGGSMDLWQQRITADGRPEGDAVAVTAGIGMQQAALAPDGRRLVYSKGHRVSSVWRVPILEDREAAWADAEQLTFDQAFIRSLDLSPDGGHLAVSSDRGGSRDIWIVPLGGGDMKRFTGDPAPDFEPRWSPDGQQIVFASYRSGNRNIWVAPLDGGPAVPLTQGEAGDLWPVWSLDGRHVAFYSNRTGNADIFMVPSEGGELRQITTEPSIEYTPQWSPDGKWLAYSSNREDGVRRIWRLLDSAGPAQIVTRGPGANFRWSPDGKRIYYTTTFGSPDLRALTLSDGSDRRITSFSQRKGSLGQYALAVGDEHLYFTWRNDLGDIWVMDVVTDEP